MKYFFLITRRCFQGIDTFLIRKVFCFPNYWQCSRTKIQRIIFYSHFDLYFSQIMKLGGDTKRFHKKVLVFQFLQWFAPFKKFKQLDLITSDFFFWKMSLTFLHYKSFRTENVRKHEQIKNCFVIVYCTRLYRKKMKSALFFYNFY